MQSPPPNPKDFSTYEEYLEALRLHEEFITMNKKVTEAINSTETEEDFNKKMEELGFTYHEDEYCEREWCQKNQCCLMIALDCLQISFNETCFAELLPEKDQIFTKESRSNIMVGDCRIPPEWLAKQAYATI